ncbi:MAG: flagellar FliJ family protein [Acidobacteria bacterium]|nr:flagellar FliJ family protein [Acidobacteriota bacterium]
MARFAFRLQVSLRLARVKRGQLRRDLADAMRELAAAEAALQDGRDRLREFGDEIERRLGEGIEGQELVALAAARDRARDALPPLRAAVKRAEMREESVREKLTAASRETEVLERLRREAHAAFVRDEERKEQTAIDDIVLVRRTREALATRARARRA